MTPRDFTSADYHRIEMEARRMRAQAIRTAFSGLWRRITRGNQVRGAARTA